MGRKRGKGRSARKADQAQSKLEPEEVAKAPHTFVLYRGQVGKYVSELVRDFRKIMEPYTASQLKVLRSNVLKDFISVAGVLNVTHMVVFTRSETATYMRIVRLPRGPTVTFRIHQYSLSRDVVSSLKRPVSYAKQFQHHPLLVLNNFSGEGQHMKLMATTFQNMFPAINIHKVKLNNIRRCVLLNYNAENKTVDFRHYTIKVVPCGMSKGVKKLVQSKIPNLANYDDISEFMLKSGNLSESEVELDGPENKVVLPQKMSSRGNIIAQQSAIRLVEMGPRLTLQLIKIEDGILDGEVLYHDIIQKTPQEVEAIRMKKAKQQKLKEKRKRQQQMNVKRKEEEKDAHKKRSSKGSTKKTSQPDAPVHEADEHDADAEPSDDAASDQDDDAEYFRKETGLEPDKEMFSSAPKKRKRADSSSKTSNFSKKQKTDTKFKPPKYNSKKKGIMGSNPKGGKERTSKKKFNDDEPTRSKKPNFKGAKGSTRQKTPGTKFAKGRRNDRYFAAKGQRNMRQGKK